MEIQLLLPPLYYRLSLFLELFLLRFFFLMWAIFFCLFEFVTLLFLFYGMFVCFDDKACGILAPWAGIEPAPPALEDEVLPTRPPWKSLELFLFSPYCVPGIMLGVLLHSPSGLQFNSVQFSCSVMSDSLQSHGLQYTKPPCPSATPRVYQNLYPLSQWCHPTISSSVIPFSSCPQSFPEPGSFQMSQLFTWGGQIIGISASTSVLLMKTQDWSPLGWTSGISLQSKRLSRVLSNTTVLKHQFFGAKFSL